MHVHAVQLVYRALEVGIARGVGRLLAPLALGPGLPVLHHAVHRYTAAAVFAGDAHQLLAACVVLLGLHIAHGPARQHGRVAREQAQRAHHAVKLRAVYHEVIHLVRRVGRKVAAKRVVVEHLRAAAVVEQRPAARGHQHGAGYLEVVLVQELMAAPVVEHALLVLAQAEYVLVVVEHEAQPGLIAAPVGIGHAGRARAHAVHALILGHGRVGVEAVADYVYLAQSAAALFGLARELSARAQPGKRSCRLVKAAAYLAAAHGRAALGVLNDKLALHGSRYHGVVVQQERVAPGLCNAHYVGSVGRHAQPVSSIGKYGRAAFAFSQSPAHLYPPCAFLQPEPAWI